MINDRLKELRTALGYTQTQFGEKIGIKKSTLSYLESGKAELTERNIMLICSEFNVNEDWLRNGGSLDTMFIKLSPEEDFNRAFAMAEEDIPPLSKQLLKLYFDNPNLQQQIEDILKTAHENHLKEKKEDE